LKSGEEVSKIEGIEVREKMGMRVKILKGEPVQ